MGADNTFGETHFNPNKWTPEPWPISSEYDVSYVKLFVNDYKRAVECVNALAGEENPERFVGMGKNYIQQDRDIRKLINADPNESTLDLIGDLMRQREELAEQVKKLTQALNQANGYIQRNSVGL